MRKLNIKEYISSGIIETYALGLASAEESRELELLAAEHSEVRAALEACQNEMEAFALKEATAPPVGLKEKIWNELQEQDAVSKQEDAPVIPIARKDFSQSAVIATVQKNNSWIKYLAAASIIGLVVSIGLNISYKNKTEKYSTTLARIETKQDSLVAQNSLLRVISGPDIVKISLVGVPGHVDNKATVYWNGNTKEVYLSLNNLPTPPSGKQYQLWAIVDGKPVDAGLYDDNGTTPKIQKLKVIERAQMFAITLEPKGGSVSPTLSQMYVAGKT